MTSAASSKTRRHPRGVAVAGAAVCALWRAGYVEPLGFSISSLRSSLLTQALIRDSGAPYRIVLDTFHHYLSDVTQADFDAQIQVTQIGLVHLSGVEDGRDKGALSDEERIMLSAGDRLESRRQVQNLERLGYTGVYAFEPFSSQLDSWSEADIEREIRHSIALLQGKNGLRGGRFSWRYFRLPTTSWWRSL